MNKTVFAILALLFNSIGVPLFIQGKTKAAIFRIVFGILSCGVIGIINEIAGIILAIKVFKMTDEEFEAQKDTVAVGIFK